MENVNEKERGTFKGINFGTVQSFWLHLALEKLEWLDKECNISDEQSENLWSKLLFFFCCCCYCCCFLANTKRENNKLQV